MKKPLNKKNTQPSSLPRKKKAFGQHFLRKHSTVDNMISKVEVGSHTTVLEIGCGDGFLTQAILHQTKCKKLLCIEIDPEWAEIVRNKITDERLEIKLQDILETPTEFFEQHKPITVLANLPYQITFPIMFLFQRNKHFLHEGVVMIQEEVAQKIVAKRGKPYGATTLFLQHHFDVELMEKVEPGAFSPPPKVFSRLLYFKPKATVVTIPQEEDFWKFVKLCFRFPRQTLRNNIKSTHYQLDQFDDKLLKQRAQQLTFNDFLTLWQKIIVPAGAKQA